MRDTYSACLPDGFEPEECIKVVEMLEEAKVDLIELSGGVYESLAFEHLKESTKKREAFFLEFASRIVPHVKKSRVVVTGGFRTLGPVRLSPLAVLHLATDLTFLSSVVRCDRWRMPLLRS